MSGARFAGPRATDRFARQATLARSLRLLGEFRFEQGDPARFYGALADDTVALVTSLWTSLHGAAPAGRTLLDVGGGPGFFADAFADRGLHYVGVEPDSKEAHAGAALAATSSRAPPGNRVRGTFVRASGLALPFADGSVDVCLSSNVAEHVAQPWRLGNEMLRVTRPGGLVVLSYTVWLGPFGGHETGLDALPRRRSGRRPLRPQTRSPPQERLRLVVVCGVGRRRPASGRRAPARWLPHSPATTHDGRGG